MLFDSPVEVVGEAAAVLGGASLTGGVGTVPGVLLGIVTWFYLTDKPEKADWLSAEQKAWLKGKLDAEVAAKHVSLAKFFFEWLLPQAEPNFDFALASTDILMDDAAIAY